MFLKASESKSVAGQTYGGASSPTMTLLSLRIKSLGLIMGLLVITVGIIISGSLGLTVRSTATRITDQVASKWLIQ